MYFKCLVFFNFSNNPKWHILSCPLYRYNNPETLRGSLNHQWLIAKSWSQNSNPANLIQSLGALDHYSPPCALFQNE